MSRWSDEAMRGAAVDLGIDINKPTWEADLSEFMLEAYRAAFDDDGDPMAPWQALAWAVHRGRPVPQWVLEYFSDRAGQLVDLFLEDRAGKSEAEVVGKSLGFGAPGPGRQSAVRAGIAKAQAAQIAVEILEAVENEPISMEEAFANAAERHGVSVSTVKRAHQEHGRFASAVVVARAARSLATNSDTDLTK